MRPVSPDVRRRALTPPAEPLRRLTRRQVTHVAPAWQEAHVAWQGRVAEAAQHPQRGREPGEQARRPMRMDVTPRLFLLRMVNDVVPIARAPQSRDHAACRRPVEDT